MTPNQLYAREPEEVVKIFGEDCDNIFYGSAYSLWGCYYTHVPEVSGDEYDTWKTSDRVEMRIYKYFNFDGRRWWRLASVWFDGIPVMIIQNAGREGDDWAKRYITDPATYKLMVDHIHSLCVIHLKELSDVVTPDAEINDLIEFYGNNLDGYFERYHY